MEVAWNLLLLVVGFVVLIKGADVFVDGASAVARRLGVSKMLVGLTIVAFGTSAPEFAVSVKSILAGNGDMMLGNVIGSNILNIVLILGITAMMKNVKIKTNTVEKELPILVLMTVGFVVLIADRIFNVMGAENGLTRQDGIILALLFGIFVYYLAGMAKKDKIELEEKETEKQEKWWVALVMTIGGILGVIFGSELVVDGASGLAFLMGVSQKMIALTVVALGTSLPELTTSVMAARKGENDIAVGNIVGSNIFNIAVVAGVPVMMFGEVSGANFSVLDIVMMLVTAVLLYLLARKNHELGKRAGVIFLVMFVVYYSYVIISA